MDAADFDALTRTLTAPRSRRVTVGGLAAGVLLALGLALDETTVLAKKKNKKKDDKKKACRGSRPIRCGDECCSLAETCRKGKKNKKDRCVGHCTDGETNFGETDTDCGGSCRDVRKCEITSRCNEDVDCVSNVCVSRPDFNPTGNVCVPCRIDSDCDRNDPGLPRCFNNACFECAINDDCPRPGQSSRRTVCRNRTCIECTSDTDCGNVQRPFCVEPVSGECPNDQPCVCAQCRTTDDCAAGQTCDETNTCISNTCPSGRDEDCPAGTLCVGFTCIECLPAGAACGGPENIPCNCCFRAVACCNEGGTAAGCTCCGTGQGCPQGNATCG